MNIQLFNEDCLENLKRMPTGYVDMVLCDLPYGTTKNKWDSIIPLDTLWSEYKRVLKESGSIVLTGQGRFSAMLILSSTVKYQYSAVWVKPGHTNQLNAKKQLLRKHEDIHIFYDKQPVYNPQGLIPKNTETRQGKTISSNWGNQGREAYIQQFTNYPTTVIQTKGRDKSFHPTQKPIELLEFLIKTFTDPGQLVLDNTMGSGSTGVACVNTGRSFVGIEKDPDYFKIAQERIAKARAGLK